MPSCGGKHSMLFTFIGDLIIRNRSDRQRRAAETEAGNVVWQRSEARVVTS
jgi:hypothetical protein